MTSVSENFADDADTPALDESLLGTYEAGDQDVDDGTGTVADASQVELKLGGDDAAAFVLGPADAEGNRELRFKASPNYEMPATANGGNAYKVSIVATDKAGLIGMRDITITVNNVDEPGTVSLSTIQPGVGQEITATLTDEDGGINGAMWQWQSSQTETGTYADIEGATSMSYTPKMTVLDDPATEDVIETVDGDEGMFLRATVTYRDAQSVDDNEDTADVEEGRRAVVMAMSENAVREVPVVNNRPMFAANITREVAENTPAEGLVGEPVTGQ